MRRIVFPILFLILGTTVSAESYDMSALYNRLDVAIAASEKAVQQRESTIRELKLLLGKGTPLHDYELNYQVFEVYSAYKNDSALAAITRCEQLARQMKRPDLVGYCQARNALQCSKAGLYAEALSTLSAVRRSDLDANGRAAYYEACNHVYGELGVYSAIGEKQQSFYHLADVYEDSILQTMDAGTELVMVKQELRALAENNFKEALKINNQRLEKYKEGTREFGVVAYYRYLIYDKMKQDDTARYWLCQSAISDVTHAVMDQAALWTLADKLSRQGDNERAYRYVRFAWHAATVFGTRVRSWQISPILSTIDQSYQKALDKRNTTLTVFIVAIAFLAILLVGLLYHMYKQRQRLATSNRKLSEVNRQLNEANQVKETYIGQFIGICSLYINKMEAQRKQVNKLVLAHKYDEVKALTKSVEQTNQEVDELYENFDSVFLHLFPHFVDDLNSLLKPDAQIQLTHPGRLTTPVRVFALIRLGIEDSSKIAEFLHYSVNTIYNYRAKVKNGAIGDRNEFEQQVKLLGTPETF